MKLTISTFEELGNLIGTTGITRGCTQPEANILDPTAWDADIDQLNNEMPRRSYRYWNNPEDIWMNEGL